MSQFCVLICTIVNKGLATQKAKMRLPFQGRRGKEIEQLLAQYKQDCSGYAL